MAKRNINAFNANSCPSSLYFTYKRVIFQPLEGSLDNLKVAANRYFVAASVLSTRIELSDPHRSPVAQIQTVNAMKNIA